MASTTQTTNYGLPIYSQNDKASWVDTNEGFSALDTDLHTAKTTAESASGQASTNAENITDLQSRMSSAEGSLTTLTGTTIPAMQTEIDSAETATGTSYNNSDSGLTATTVQSAIDEVIEESGKIIATITGDGVMTYGQALHTFYDTINALSDKVLNKGLVLDKVPADGSHIYHYLRSYTRNSVYQFSGTNVNSYGFISQEADIRHTGQTSYQYCIIDTGGYQFSDMSSTVLELGTILNIIQK